MITTLKKEVDGVFDALVAYRKLVSTSASGPSALLETVDIHSREHTQSILMLSAALKVVCRDFKVCIQAQNINGAAALDFVAKELPCFTMQEGKLSCDFSSLGNAREKEEQKKLFDISVFKPLRQLMSRMKVAQSEDNISTMLIGYFSFELLSYFEDIEYQKNTREFPDFEFYLADQLLVIDHQQSFAKLCVKIFPGQKSALIQQDYEKRLSSNEALLKQCRDKKSSTKGNRSAQTELLQYQTNLSDEAYIKKVKKIKQHIREGDVSQTVLARRFSLPCTDSLAAYEILREQNPSPYMFFIEDNDYQLFGASPESAVKVNAEKNTVSIYPIAGTRPRGFHRDGSIDSDLDSRMEAELRIDAKELAEHMMLVDLARNDIARISKPATRHLTRLLDVDRYSYVMHLVSQVVGELREGFDCFTAYRACMNMGTLTGAPKVRASQLIEQYEDVERGPYGGAVGYFNAQGDMDTAIVIRSAIVKNNTAWVSAGAGIVLDSNPESEAQETKAKATAVLRAIDTANQLHMDEKFLAREIA